MSEPDTRGTSCTVPGTCPRLKIGFLDKIHFLSGPKIRKCTVQRAQIRRSFGVKVNGLKTESGRSFSAHLVSPKNFESDGLILMHV